MGRDERLKFQRRQVLGASGDMVDAMHVVIDRFGRQLTTGDIVIHNPANPIAMQIVKLVPLLDPKAPPGLVTLTAIATFNFHVPKGKPLMDVVLVDVATQQESDETKRENVDGEPQEDPARDPARTPFFDKDGELPEPREGGKERERKIVLTDAPPPPKGDDDA